MGKSFLCGIHILLVVFTFTACQLLPEEAVLPKAPILHSYEVKEYKMDIVKRGDLIKTTSVSCNYMPAKEEDLSFSQGGILIDKIYVSEGQQVKKGDLLAGLVCDDLLDQKEQLEYELRVLRMKIEHYKEQQEIEEIILELKRVKAEEKQAEESQYIKLIQDAEDSIYLAELRLKEIREALELRNLKAGLDGVVTYALKVQEGDRSVKDNRVITISDMDSTAFLVKGTTSQYFEEGMEVVIRQQKQEYEAVVVDGTELGLEENPEDTVYLKPVHPDPTLEEGARGSINVVLEEKRNVLYVDQDAVKTSNGETFVYMPDENGLRVMRPVIVGMECEGNLEIISGLSEGESVILD